MIDSLPHEVLRHVLSYLLGTELLLLPSVSRSLHSDLKHDTIWRSRFTNDVSLTAASWKQLYLAATSLRFSGEHRGGAIPLGTEMAEVFTHKSFTVALWLSLERPTPGSLTNVGGVVLGAQSTSWMEADQAMPDAQLQLIHADNGCNLYCSMLEKQKTPVSKLDFDRWYHVAVTFSHAKQHVFLDGELMRTDSSVLHSQWATMKALQFGTGFMGCRSIGSPSPEFSGWYGFTGLLESPRVWDCQLSATDIQSLSQGEPIDRQPPVWSPHSESALVLGNAGPVKCSRPLERICTVLTTDRSPRCSSPVVSINM